MEQLTPLGVEPGEQDSAVKSLVALKNELAEEKLAQEKAQTDTDTLSRAVEELKKIADQLSARVPPLEDQVKHLDNKILDLLNELQARELCLERTTIANDDFKSQNT
jgi:predicted  nucleic acid-binding Zn-ribbon protein